MESLLNTMSVVAQNSQAVRLKSLLMLLSQKIQDIKIYGDFFGIEDVAAVEDVLRGVKYEREDVLKALQTINLGRYFAGITAEEIAEAVVE